MLSPILLSLVNVVWWYFEWHLWRLQEQKACLCILFVYGWFAFDWKSILFLLFQVSKSAELQAKWKHCAITQQPLLPPIVACELGRWVEQSLLHKRVSFGYYLVYVSSSTVIALGHFRPSVSTSSTSLMLTGNHVSFWPQRSRMAPQSDNPSGRKVWCWT